ncbi:iron-containing redox enzyme family protein [Nocardia yamanashiensis]|uniref:iron-containing redox enzyme family protein n=1 Tax=Nocardia yamanashiensis TaxID=209247 RepID=UPI00082DD19F|nr:iron-containing redox enzyme family protein [Nocardia yamanashiensis]
MHPFGSALPTGTEPPAGDAADARSAYGIAVDPEYQFPQQPLVSGLRDRLVAIGDSNDLDELIRRTAEWGKRESGRYRELLDTATDRGVTEGFVRRIVLGCAPISLMAGAWLQWLNRSGTCEDDLALRILALYADDVGAGRPRRSRGDAYLGLMRSLQISEYAEPVSRLPADSRIPGYAFDFAARLLLMSRKPEEFAGELMGVDLCLRTVALLPPLAAVQSGGVVPADWQRIDLSTARSSESQLPVDRSAAIVTVITENSTDSTPVRHGFAWALAELERWSTLLFDELVRMLDPAVEMAELVRSRAREAYVYHHDFRLAGRSLSDWFKQARTDPAPFVRALATSRLIRPGRPEASPLVTTLVAERGRMFRVFTEEDLSTIRRWISALPTGDSEPDTIMSENHPTTAVPIDGLYSPPEQGEPPRGLREAYYLLHSRRQSVALNDYAMDYVRCWLDRARDTEVHLPKVWDSVGLRPWLLDQHDRHALEYEQTDEPLPTREELVEESIQLAPMILIDGAWLQGFTDYSLASTEIGFSLFATYWDELGNSELRLNHPLIYRQLLGEMGIDAPPTASKEFSEWDRFKDSSFAVPVYWLSLSRFPLTFTPELLGLNLAIELSGVGGTYRRMRRAHSAHKFDTRFIDIHSTIDNVSTGHSAWASDAIDIYLASILKTEGADATASVWRRVRNGYAALNPADIGL